MPAADRPKAPRPRTRKITRTAIEEHIKALRRAQPVDTFDQALATMAMDLAEHIDRGVPVHMTGTWHRELRATLEILGRTVITPAGRGEEADGHDDDAEVEDPDAWLAGLSTQVRDPEEG